MSVKVDDPVAASLAKAMDEQKKKIEELEAKLKEKETPLFKDVQTIAKMSEQKVKIAELEAKLKDGTSPLLKDVQTITRMKVDEMVKAAFPKATEAQKKVIDKLVNGKPLDEVKDIIDNYTALLPETGAPTLDGIVPIPGKTGDRKGLFGKDRPSPYQMKDGRWQYIA